MAKEKSFQVINAEGFSSEEEEEELLMHDDDDGESNKIHVTLTNKYPGLQGFGLDISGGMDRPFFHGDHGIFVSALKDKGLAEKSNKIHVGDKILEVNGVNVENISHKDAVTLFVANKNEVSLKIHKNIGLLLRAASATPTPSQATTPDENLEVTPRVKKVPPPSSGISITGFVVGIAIGCVSVMLLKKYMFSNSSR